MDGNFPETRTRSLLKKKLRVIFAGYFFSSVEVELVVPAAPSFIDDLKLRMPSPSPLPSSPNFLGPKMSRAMNTITASSGRPIFPPNIVPPVKQPGQSAFRHNRKAGLYPNFRLLAGTRQRARLCHLCYAVRNCKPRLTLRIRPPQSAPPEELPAVAIQPPQHTRARHALHRRPARDRRA